MRVFITGTSLHFFFFVCVFSVNSKANYILVIFFPFLFSLKRIIHSEYQSYSYRCVVDFNLISWLYLNVEEFFDVDIFQLFSVFKCIKYVVIGIYYIILV